MPEGEVSFTSIFGVGRNPNGFQKMVSMKHYSIVKKGNPGGISRNANENGMKKITLKENPIRDWSPWIRIRKEMINSAVFRGNVQSTISIGRDILDNAQSLHDPFHAIPFHHVDIPF